VKTADRIDAKFIVALTNTGYGARILSRHRSQLPILAFSPNADTVQKLGLNFGVQAFAMNTYTDFEHAVADIKKVVTANKIAKKGDKFVIVGSRPFGKSKTSNMMIVEEM
jgi:pyruvate kinase